MNNNLISKKDVLDKLDDTITYIRTLAESEQQLVEWLEELKILRKEREDVGKYIKSYYESKFKNIINKLDRECLGKPVPEEFERGINRAIEIIMEER